MEPKSALDSDGAALVSTLFKEHRSRVFRYLLKNLRDRDLAKDITSNTFLKVADAVLNGKYKDQNNPKAWVMTIAHNEMIEYFRALKRSSKKDGFDRVLNLRDPELNPLEILEQPNLRKKLRSLVEKLPIKEKEIFTFRFSLRMSFNEIAKTMGINGSTLRARHHRAKQRLRKMLVDLANYTSSKDNDSG